MNGKTRNKRLKQARRLEQALPSYQARRWTMLGLLMGAASLLIWRAVDQQIFETDFLQNEGQRRHLRVVEMSAHRGMIKDRLGEPVAISTPVDSVWANPRTLSPDSRILVPIAKILQMDLDSLRQLLARRSDRSFVYLKRRINPDRAAKLTAYVSDNEIAGVGLQREYRRYYPDGEVFAHVVGFTNVDDEGQEGLELAYDEWLQGTSGKKRVIQDGRARAVKDVENILEPEAGKDLITSIDRRLQFLAYRELKGAVQRNKAKAGSAVILDARNGEILAMVNQPAYNPNGSKQGKVGRFRNRAVTDVFEPGSTVKPFTIAAALESGRYTPGTVIDTAPGTMKVGRHQVKDHRNYGAIDLSRVILKSSNVGVSKIALDLPKEKFWGFFSKMGFGEATSTGFPGEVTGQLAPYRRWAEIDQATLAFGYGLSVTPLQLARAYVVLASDGMRYPTSLIRQDEPVKGERVMKAKTAKLVRKMMEAVVTEEGTAPAAAVPGYRVAGKTGTAKKSISGGYADDQYISVFAGIAPASDPRLVMVVMIDEPSAGEYYGGSVAAPVFSSVMAGALRMLNVAPDALDDSMVKLAGSGGVK
ncbi:peptidoglycan D,D-transpeptidase FtsI family protein [Sedimenticola selenatireducens]|uniref:Peptidoglycan D,D-transpeptidase FtsI n=1 Tax=Sedimenticola selenatireducens TaxID=191960 RepID=A0A557S070_9GAMM|nr:penicillin-binding transpeptidase domain-containing protein [Sedimenticola selenatireducens]TVO70801.1 penicillin-binding protein 2 [Sedimenticola selenatireducens]TVT65721.1 MAG: penicillin-binding protein 2 [Sedimenticola selenatireducens]